jgi:hypothetical protein
MRACEYNNDYRSKNTKELWATILPQSMYNAGEDMPAPALIRDNTGVSNRRNKSFQVILNLGLVTKFSIARYIIHLQNLNVLLIADMLFFGNGCSDLRFNSDLLHLKVHTWYRYQISIGWGP